MTVPGLVQLDLVAVIGPDGWRPDRCLRHEQPEAARVDFTIDNGPTMPNWKVRRHRLVAWPICAACLQSRRLRAAPILAAGVVIAISLFLLLLMGARDPSIPALVMVVAVVVLVAGLFGRRWQTITGLVLLGRPPDTLLVRTARTAGKHPHDRP